MAYIAAIGWNNLTVFLFFIDRSGLMSKKTSEGLTKAPMLSDAMNKLFGEMILKFSKEEGVRNHLEIGVIGTGTHLLQRQLCIGGGTPCL
jgi:hypothetical protein